MIELVHKKFKSAVFADADIHGGGNFFWKTYYKQIEFGDDGAVIVKKVLLKENGIDRNVEFTLYTGKYLFPSVGRYTVELYLQDLSKNIEINYCGLVINDNQLIMHGTVSSKVFDRITYETEIFGMIRE